MASGGKGPGAAALLTLPSFLFSVFVFYWSLPIFAVPYRIRFANLVGPRNDVLDWWAGPPASGGRAHGLDGAVGPRGKLPAHAMCYATGAMHGAD